MSTVQALVGLPTFLLVAWALGTDRRAVRPRLVLGGFVLQVLLALVLLRAPGIAEALLALNQGVVVLEEVTGEATRFMFGYLAGGTQPFAVVPGGNDFIVAFRVLPLILVVSALSAVLFHWGVLPWVIRLLARGLRRGFGLSGPLGFGAAASVFFGIIESPLLVKPYLARMSPGELLALMTCGMATVAGTVMVLYASVVGPVLEGALGHILVASAISVPAALVMAHLMMPVDARTDPDVVPERKTGSAMEALMQGTAEGTRMVIDIAATIIVLFACVYLANRVLGLIPTAEPLTIQGLVGLVLAPLVWLMGVPAAELGEASRLMGTKTVLNEFVAYMELAGPAGESLSAHTRLILVYAMCGFANLGSLGILVGGLGSILPDRRGELAALGLRALVAGTLATCMTGALAGLIAG